MRALVIEGGVARLRKDVPPPDAKRGETRVAVLSAGVCATDLALLRGYMGFAGIPGHEFVGVALDGPLAGQRVVGGINAACGTCAQCLADLGRHCSQRTVLGILGRPGALADQLSLPTSNLAPVPDSVSTTAATFTEPLAAAFEMAEQLDLATFQRALVAGDGRLGLLCAHVLHAHGLTVTVAGRHPEREPLLPKGCCHVTGLLEDDERGTARWPLVVEATGRPENLPRVLSCVKPRGTLVLKTTTETPVTLDLAPLVVDEITLLGSRCGRLAPALTALSTGLIPVEDFVDARFALSDGAEALRRAAEPGVLKVIIDVNGPSELSPLHDQPDSTSGPQRTA